jgi:hypothetical protein
MQVLYHATAASLEYVLFIVASKMNVIYATLIWFPQEKRNVFLGILTGVYNRSLKWAWEDAWEANDPLDFNPLF